MGKTLQDKLGDTELPSPGKRIDIHCHFFNRKELSVFMLLDIARMLSRAELTLRESRRDVRREREAQHLSRGVRSALLFAVTSMLSPKRILGKLKRKEEGFAFCPLTLDLYGLTRKQEDEEDALVNTDRLIDLVREEVEKVSERSAKLSEEKGQTLGRRGMAIELRRMGGMLKKLLSKRAYHSTWIGGKTPDGFGRQVEEMERLARERATEIFPFYSVDPRRESNYKVRTDGTYDLTPITSKLRRNGGVFVGFKLYTPLGYSPTHPMLMAMYAYCEREGVPVIAHVSGSGLTTLANRLWVEGDVYEDGEVKEVRGVWRFKERGLMSRERVLEHCETLNHPMLWEKVLRRFPNLKIDLAHFGHLPGTTAWTREIWRLMTERREDGSWAFPNLYTDLSNIPTEEGLRRMREAFFVKEEDLKRRFLYGSDYYMNMIYERDMEEYAEHFKRVFTSEEWDMMTIENPRRFLSVKG